jgi:hypothetical protein
MKMMTDKQCTSWLCLSLFSDPRLSFGSQQPVIVQTPTFVAELTEAQAFIADIPPLVST